MTPEDTDAGTIENARMVRDRIAWMRANRRLNQLLDAVREMNPGGPKAERHFGIEIHFKEFVGGKARGTPIALILPAYGGPGGEVDAGVQFFSLPGDWDGKQPEKDA